MKKVFVSILALFMLVPLFINAQTKDGSVTDDVLKEVRKQFSNEPQASALMNAISNNKIKDLVLNRNLVGKVDHYFSYRVKAKGITNQKSSGRCWLFSGLNVFRPTAIEKLGINEFEFSQNYNFFWDQFEKANLFLEGIIATSNKQLDDRTVDWLFKNPINDGGQWTTFADVVIKYGLVPSSVMPETKHSENTGELTSLLSSTLRTYGMALRAKVKSSQPIPYADLRVEKVKMLSDIYRILCYCLGEPPTSFSWRYKDSSDKIVDAGTFTPQSFYQKMIGIDLKNYVMFMNDPSRDYYKLYEIQYDRNMADGHNWHYINLPVADLKELAKKSIMDNEALYFSCDVGKQLNSAAGVLNVGQYQPDQLFSIKLNMDKKQRIQTSESSSSHGMALIGVDVDKDGRPVNWLLENSWGAESGHNGYLTMTDKWFEEYMFRLVVNKKYISSEILKILDKEAIFLPPWDPMFSPEQ